MCADGKPRFTLTTGGNHGLAMVLKLRNRQFAVDVPDKVWVAMATAGT